MARRKRYIKGRVYIINDSLFSPDGYSKSGRRVVAVNNDRNNMHVVKVKKLVDDKGKARKNMIPIEKYSVIRKSSGVYPYVYKKTAAGDSIRADKRKKTNVRLNKWDMKKISHLK